MNSQEKHQKSSAQRTKAERKSEASATDASDEKVAEISAALAEELRHERDEYLESLQRLQAEFANFRKRVLKESQQAGLRASQQVIEDLLPVLDNFERAMKAAAEHEQQALAGGIELVYGQLRDLLTRRGLCEIKAHGQAFDPNRHEAVLCQPSAEHEEGTVMEVLEKGYQLEDKVVRPAKVIVSQGSKPSQARNEDDGEAES